MQQWIVDNSGLVERHRTASETSAESCSSSISHVDSVDHVSETDNDDDSISIMTWNVYAGAPMDLCYDRNKSTQLDGSPRLDRQCKFLSRLRPDIICLQEVMRKSTAQQFLDAMGSDYDIVCSCTHNYRGYIGYASLLLLAGLIITTPSPPRPSMSWRPTPTPCHASPRPMRTHSQTSTG